MAQGVLTALQAALAGVSGGITGAQQYREMEQKRKREAEAANMQRDLFRLQLIQASGGRLAPPTEPVRAAAPAAPAMAMPSTDTVLQRALARTQTQEFGPMATTATQAALEPGRRQALGMETPPLARTSLGELLDRQTGRLGMAGAMPTPMAEAAPAPVRLTSQPPAVPTPTRRRETLGGMEFEVIPAETPAEKRARELKELEETEGLKARLLAQSQETAAKRLAESYVKAYKDEKGNPISYEIAYSSALMGKNPIESGFIRQRLSARDEEELRLRNADLQLRREQFNFDKTKQDPNAPAPTDFTTELQVIQDFLPTVGKDGKVVQPKRKLSGARLLAVQEGGPAGTFYGKLSNLGLSAAGADMTDEQLYNTIAEGIATSYAIQEQRGRNVSDRDIANRISQIKVLPNEVGSIEVQRLKGQRLQQWANRLMGGTVPQIQPGQTFRLPSDQEQTGSRPPISSFIRR